MGSSSEYTQALWDRLVSNDLTSAKPLLRSVANYVDVDNKELVNLVIDKLETSNDPDFRSAAAILLGAGDTERSVKEYLQSLLGE